LGQLFGTDGVRGLANREITAELALDLAVAAAHVLGDVGAFGAARPRAVVGRDTRASGEFLEAAVVAGLASAGVDVTVIGVAPTPAVAYLTDALDADLGVMLSASHNPMPDNGIKFFARGGVKLPDGIEEQIEARIGEPWERPLGADVGRVLQDGASIERYEQHLLQTLSESLTGLTVVVDCANGAASDIAPEVYHRAGAQVISLHAEPDGCNINRECGSTHLADLQQSVVHHGADLGIAHDGDADRCLAVDHTGALVDGDHILAMLALGMFNDGRLVKNTVVSTVMANLGFQRAMEAAGIVSIQTAVGDRYVLETMREWGYVLGGEQSGHVILGEYATTGDGILTALHVMAEMKRTGRSLAQLAAIVDKLPQVLVNVPGIDHAALQSDVIRQVIDEVERDLGERGRVLLRPSGTEPLVRVMVEATTADQAEQVAHRIASALSDFPVSGSRDSTSLGG